MKDNGIEDGIENGENIAETDMMSIFDNVCNETG